MPINLTRVRFYGTAGDLEPSRETAGIPPLHVENRVLPDEQDDHYEVRVTNEDARKLVDAFRSLRYVGRLFTLTGTAPDERPSYRTEREC